MAVRDLTPQGRVGKLVVRGARLTSDLSARVRGGGTLTLSTSEPTTLALSLVDEELDVLDSRLLAPGAAVDYQNLKFAVSVSEPGDDAGVTHLSVTARSLGIRNLRRQRGAARWKNTTPTSVVSRLATKAGLKVVAQPSGRRKQIARGKKESSWGLVQRLAKELGYACFESDGTLFFGKPTWLVGRSGAVVRRVEWDRRAARPVGSLHRFPTCRRSEDAKKNAATIDLELLGAGAEDWRTGDVLQLAGVPTFDGHYLVTRVEIPLEDETPVRVVAETPVNPEKQKQKPLRPRSSGRGRRGSSGGSGGSGGAPSSGGTSTSAGGTVERFVQTALRQVGDRYVFGAEASKSDPDPDAFDCSELVEWALARVGVYIPDGSAAQRAWCQQKGRGISVEQAINTRGALLFANGHIAISLGGGRTVEAVNRSYGVTTMNARGRQSVTWIGGGLVPGLVYPKRRG